MISVNIELSVSATPSDSYTDPVLQVAGWLAELMREGSLDKMFVVHRFEVEVND